MVRKTTRRGKRVLVIDFTFTKPDGTQGRYRRDAAVQTAAAAQTELTARRMGATLYGDPEILCGPNGQLLKPIEAAPDPEPAKELTFAETVNRYFAEYAPSALSPSTIDGHRSVLHLHFVPRLGALPVSDAFDVARSRAIDVAMIEAGLAPSTRRQTLLALRSVARFALEAKIILHVPCFLPLPKQGKRVPSAPPAGDVAMVIDAASCPAHELVLLLAAHAGLRKGEIRALRCGDCEMDRNRIVVRLSRYRKVTKATKSGHEREVPLTARLKRALLAAGVDKRPKEECAALTSRGEPWGCKGPYQVFQRTLRRLKLPTTRLHALRAFFVTALLKGHVPVHVVRELVGHGNLATTQMYAAVVEGDQGAAVQVLDRLFENTGEGSADSQGAIATRRPACTKRTARRRRGAIWRRVLLRRGHLNCATPRHDRPLRLAVGLRPQAVVIDFEAAKAQARRTERR
jgi:integrase